MENTTNVVCSFFIKERIDTFVSAFGPLHPSTMLLIYRTLFANQVTALGVQELAKVVSLSDTEVSMGLGAEECRDTFLTSFAVSKRNLESYSKTSADFFKVSDCASICFTTADELAEIDNNTILRWVFTVVGVPLLLKLFDEIF